MAIHEIRVGNTEKDTRGQDVAQEAQRTIGIPGLEGVRTARVYRLEGVTEEGAQSLAETLLAEPIDQTYTLNQPLITDTPRIVEVAYKPGVMNPEAASIMKSAHDLGIDLAAADASTEYAFYGAVEQEQVDQVVNGLLVNKIVERVVYEKPETLIINFTFFD